MRFMAQKKAKKSKPAKAKKPVKPAKPAGVGAVLKKAAKLVAKKIAGPQHASKKPATGKKLVVVPAPKAGKPGKASAKALPPPKGKPQLVLVKGKKDSPKPKVPALKAVPAAKGGKKKEVVLEVPAPKGVALLGREGKKKGKAQAEPSVSRKRCREPGCEHDFSLQGYCRLHYIKNWRRIKRKESILSTGQLNNYVEELVNKYPDRYLDVIRQDLASEKEWGKVVTDLELEASEEEMAAEDDIDSASESVRPSSGGGGGSRSSGSDFDEEGEF